MTKLFKVGGCVRDDIIGRPCNDIDYAVEALSFKAMEDMIVNKLDGKIFLSKPEFNTIRAKVDNEALDFVLCRKEYGYSDGRHPDKVETGTIYDDLSRRDFTMNAIAWDINNNRFIDPYNGIRHINAKIIRCVGKGNLDEITNERFNEDSLRILRAMRFSITLGFNLEPEITRYMKKIDNIYKLENVSSERIREELKKCFAHSTINTLKFMEQYKEIRNFVFDRNKTWLEPTNKKIRKCS